eukprot:6207948-Pleurochrysis_carterae.AAC.3
MSTSAHLRKCAAHYHTSDGRKSLEQPRSSTNSPLPHWAPLKASDYSDDDPYFLRKVLRERLDPRRWLGLGLVMLRVAPALDGRLALAAVLALRLRMLPVLPPVAVVPCGVLARLVAVRLGADARALAQLGQNCAARVRKCE